MTTVTASQPKAGPKFKDKPVDGYEVTAAPLEVRAAFDQLKATDKATSPQWLTRCNLHGSTTPAANRKAGRALGSAAARATWCKGCKIAAAKTAAAK
jgi:hypothetical protein